MNINEIVYKHYNKQDDKHKRKIGVYWATDIKKIKDGTLTPENFLSNTKEEVDWTSVGNIFTGCAYEAELINILKQEKIKCTPHKVKDIKIGKNIILRVNLDIWFKGGIAECKAPTKLRWEIPEWYKDQMEIYHRAWKKDVFCYMFVPRNEVGNLKKLIIEIKYKPSIIRWKNNVKLIKDFDKAVKQFNKKLIK